MGSLDGTLGKGTGGEAKGLGLDAQAKRTGPEGARRTPRIGTLEAGLRNPSRPPNPPPAPAHPPPPVTAGCAFCRDRGPLGVVCRWAEGMQHKFSPLWPTSLASRPDVAHQSDPWFPWLGSAFVRPSLARLPAKRAAHTLSRRAMGGPVCGNSVLCTIKSSFGDPSRKMQCTQATLRWFSGWTLLPSSPPPLSSHVCQSLS